MKDFFDELYDRLQHKEQLTRKNATDLSELKFADGISSTRKIINELRLKYKV